jgi:hypothetical protein
MTEQHPDEQLLLDLALGEVDRVQREQPTGANRRGLHGVHRGLHPPGVPGRLDR